MAKRKKETSTREQRFEDYKQETLHQEIVRKIYTRKWATPEIVEDDQFIFFGEMR